MKTSLAIGLALLSMIGVAHADDTLRFATEGFSIKALHPTVGAVPVQVMNIFLNAEGGFAPNVNVQIQPYAGTIDDYLKDSTDQFKQLGFTTLGKKKVNDDTVLLEYTGSMPSMPPMHWYARAVRKKGKNLVYLVTGTTLVPQWTKSGAEIKTCVDSFKLD
jgi:hypothetical protein